MKNLLILISCTIFAGCNVNLVPNSIPQGERDRQSQEKARKEQAEREHAEQERERQEAQKIEKERQQELRRQNAQRERDKKLAEEAALELARKAQEKAAKEAADKAEEERPKAEALAKIEEEFDKKFAKFLEVYQNNDLINPWGAREAIQWKYEVDNAFNPVKDMLSNGATDSEEFKAKRQALNAVQRQYKNDFVNKYSHTSSRAKDNEEKLSIIDKAIDFEKKNKEKIADYREQTRQYEKAKDEFKEKLSEAVTKQELRSKEGNLLVRKDNGYWFNTGRYSSTSFNENFNASPFDTKSSEYWSKNLAAKQAERTKLWTDAQTTLTQLKGEEGFVNWEEFISSGDLAAAKTLLLEEAAKYQATKDAFDKAVADFKAYLESKLE